MKVDVGAAWYRQAPDHVPLPSAAPARVELRVDPLHAREIDADHHRLGHELPNQLLDHDWMAEQSVVEGIRVLPVAHCWLFVGHRRYSVSNQRFQDGALGDPCLYGQWFGHKM